MRFPVVLFCVSALVCVFGLAVPEWSDVLLLGGPCAIAALWLVWRAWLKTRLAREPRRPDPQIDISAHKWVILDGSNVMHWIDNTPNIKPIRDVLDLVHQRGYTAGVMFDANAGHKLFGKYWHDDMFGKRLGLPEDRVMVVPKGTVADQYILTAARDYGAKIITNDRFRDWADEFPEVRNKGFLISGWYRDGQLHTALR